MVVDVVVGVECKTICTSWGPQVIIAIAGPSHHGNAVRINSKSTHTVLKIFRLFIWGHNQQEQVVSESWDLHPEIAGNTEVTCR